MRRAGVEPGLLDGIEDTGARQEADAEGRLERESTAPARHHVDDQLGVFPDLELQGADVERGAADVSEQDVTGTDPEFAARIAHRGTAVTAAPRLVEEQGAVLRFQTAKHGRRRLGDQHPIDGVLVLRVGRAQKNPIFFGL
jgi:hypothetical protein